MWIGYGRMFLRRFDLEHTFRFLKQTLGWTKPRIRTPAAADRWTWLVIGAHTQLRLEAVHQDHTTPNEPPDTTPAKPSKQTQWSRVETSKQLKTQATKSIESKSTDLNYVVM